MAKVVIVGAGHNGLVTACYLARAGHSVTVFEKRHVVGGSCVTDETIFPGCKVSAAAYVNSMFLPQIVEDFDLKSRGYEVLLRDPSSFTPLLDGRYLFLGHDRQQNEEEISKFSEKDAWAYPKYEAMLDRAAKLVGSLMTITPPNFPPYRWSDFRKFGYLAWKMLRMGPVSNWQFARLMTADAVKLLNRWFESDVLKATLLLDSTIGALDFRGYLLLHHVMGEAGGFRGVWGYMRGGVGAICEALADAALEMGVKIYVESAVDEIVVYDNQLCGVRVGEEVINADVVISNADPYLTFTKLISAYSPNVSRFCQRIQKLDFKSATMKVNLKLSALPNFKCLPSSNYAEVGPQHRGTIHLASSVDYITHAALEARYGLPSAKPVLEATIPTALDNTLAPPGKHLMNIFVQYTPYHLKYESWEESDLKKYYFEKHILPILVAHMSNMPDIIEDVHIYSPLDLERELSLTGGNILHGAMTLPQMFSFRPLRGWAEYRTPVKGLYLCGAGTHPGGGISGANGYNAAREIIADLER